MSTRPPHRRPDRRWAFRAPPAPHPRMMRPPRRFRVVLHRAAGLGLMVVARAVMEVTRFGPAEAEFRMWEAHHRGRSLVLVTHLERAELFVEQFAARGLATSIEPE